MSIINRAEPNRHSLKRRKLEHRSEDNNGSPPPTLLDEQDDGDDSEDDDEQKHKAVPQRIRKIDEHQSRSHVASGAKTSANVLQIKVKDLLSHHKVDHAAFLRKSKITTDSLIRLITDTEPTGPLSFAQAQTFAKEKLNVRIPWTLRAADEVNYSFEFKAPTRATLEGIAPQGLSTKKESRFVIVPEMPAQLFQDKDYLNQRALHKRAFYLACIASSLEKQSEIDFRVRFTYHVDNEYIPILLVSSSEGQAQTFQICPSFPESLGPIDRMRPDQNCLRKHSASEHAIDGKSAVYNSTIRQLASVSTVRRLIEEAKTKADNFTEACQIGTVWLQQRGFSSSKLDGGFGMQEWALLCALLLESGGHQGRPLFSPRYSAVQLFKAMLQVLGNRDALDPFVLRGSTKLESSGIPIIYDAATGINVMYKTSTWSYAKLRSYATSSLAAVNAKIGDPYEFTFNTDISDSGLEFDEMYELDLRDNSLPVDQLFPHLHKVLQQGLGNRVALIDLQTSASQIWKPTSSRRAIQPANVVVGISICPDTANRLIDHGPSVEDKVASDEFRGFWGEKAELRRFKDGRISESVMWTPGIPATQQIIQYLAHKYFDIPATSVRTPPDLVASHLHSSLSAEEAFAVVNSKFQSLSSTLHHLDGLPLPVRSVSAASDLTRSASQRLPLEPGSAKPINVLVQFDTSGRWPDDLRAIQYTKIAFLTKIGDILTQKDTSFQCRVGLENDHTVTVGTHNTSFLDVIQRTTAGLPPIVFRLRIFHDRELHLVQQALSSKSSLAPVVRETYQAGFDLHKRAQASISHTMAIRTLITAFPPLSATIRLLKRFISAHRLSQHIPSEVAEIIAAQIFLRPAPWSVPGTATTAFARCLHLVSRWDWSAEPLIVDLSLSQDMSSEQRQELETRFIAWRKMDPNMNTVAWIVGTNLDATGVVWTQSSIPGQDPQPARVIAGRLTALASAAVELFKSVGDRESKIMTERDWNDVFVSSIDHFDFVLELKKGVIGGKRSASCQNSSKFKNLKLAEVLEADTTGIEPVQCYVKDLENAFGHVALFFYGDELDRVDSICGLWRPHLRKGATVKRELKIRLGVSTKPLAKVKDEETGDRTDFCEVNMDGMLAEMSLLGAGLVDRITSK